MKSSKFQELLIRAKANIEAAKREEAEAAAASIEAAIITNEVSDVEIIGLDNAKLTVASVESEEAQEACEIIQAALIAPNKNDNPSEPKIVGVARQVTLNENQQKALDLVLSGKDCVLIGAAGTGKTTTAGKITRELIDREKIKPLNEGTKWLYQGLPGAVIVSFTNKAVNNIRHAVAEDLKKHTITIHKLLEYAPIYYEIDDPEHPGQFKKTMRFEPTRNSTNPLPRGLGLLVFEESSMIGTELYRLLQEALPHYHQEVFLGDIQQLPPVFGMAILGFKMLELPVVELTEIYRQAAQSPIINLAWKILEGKVNDFSPKTETFTATNSEGRSISKIRVPALDALSVRNEVGEVKFQVFQKKLTEDTALNTFVKQFCVWSDQGYYNPQEDIILCPFNVKFGTIEINKGIAQYLGVKRGAIVYEVIAGLRKHYLAIGDRVLYDKEDAFITDIKKNGSYLGKSTMPAHKGLDRWGHLREELSEEEKFKLEEQEGEIDMEAIERYLELASDEIEERTNAASHIITVRTAYGDEEHVLEDSREVNNLLGGYAITVHKAQGSEYEKVFIVLHHSYAVMLNRELLYTAVTRAKRFIHIICEIESFFKGVRTQAILGNTLEDKARYFQGKASKKENFDIKDTYKNGPKEASKEPDPPTNGGGVSIKNKESVDFSGFSDKVDAEPVKIVRMHELVSMDFKMAALAKLSRCWAQAKSIFGEKIGEKPRIDYRLQRRNLLGRAYAYDGLIQLNPVWCILADTSEVIAKEMLEDTLIHELCHVIAARYSDSKAHDAGWIMAMKLMGIYDPQATYDDDTLPPWTEAYREIMLRKQEELHEQGVEE